MSTESLTFNFALSSGTGETSVLDTPYVRLEQVLPVEETATLGEVAEILESLYTIDPCNPILTAERVEEIEEAESEGVPPFSVEEFNTSIAQFMKLPSCFIDEDGNWSTQVKVILSDPNLPYSLKLSNGIITQTILVKETYKETITIENRKGILLSYPIVVEDVYSDDEIIKIESPTYTGQISFQWDGSVLVNGIGAVPPPVTVIGNTLYWGEEVTGSLTVEYPTKYFLVDVTVYGTEANEPGMCSAICFYEQMVDTLDLQKPDDGEQQNEYCGEDSVLVPGPTGGAAPIKRQNFYIIQTEWKCQCSGDHSHWTFSPDMTEAQRNSGVYYSSPIYRKVFGGYIDCGETDQDIATDEFYIENCCDPPEFELPKCATVYRKNNGGYELDPEVEAFLVAEYGDQLQIVYVMPEDGECGRLITEQELHPLSCCDEVTDMEWDEDSNPEVLPSDSAINLNVIDGSGIYTWRTSSNGTFFSNGTKSITISNVSYVTLYADTTFCGITDVSVTDGCSSISEALRSTEGEWVDMGSGCKLYGHIGQENIYSGGSNWQEFAYSGKYKQRSRIAREANISLLWFSVPIWNMYPRPGYDVCASSCLKDSGKTVCDCFEEGLESIKAAYPDNFNRECLITYDPFDMMAGFTECAPVGGGNFNGLYYIQHPSGIRGWACVDENGTTQSGWRGYNYGAWFSSQDPTYWEWRCE